MAFVNARTFGEHVADQILLVLHAIISLSKFIIFVNGDISLFEAGVGPTSYPNRKLR